MTVVILARAPSASGKTRLTGHLPEGRARRLRERLLIDTAAAARRAGHPLVVSFTPETAEAEMRRLVPDAQLVAQRGEDLGDRMRNALHDVLAAGPGPAVLIGSDLPTLPPERLTDAFAMLASGAEIVLGPSSDGGFYLIGAGAPLPNLFGGITWGEPDVFARVSDAARAANLSLRIVGEWWDVDAPRDLQRLGSWYTEFLV